MLKVMFVAIIGFFIAIGTVQAEPVDIMKLREEVATCVNKSIWKGVGWSALYGGGIFAAAAAISGNPVGAVVVAGVTGAALGGGASAVTRLSDQATFKREPLVGACLDSQLLYKERAETAVKRLGNSMVDKVRGWIE